MTTEQALVIFIFGFLALLWWSGKLAGDLVISRHEGAVKDAIIDKLKADYNDLLKAYNSEAFRERKA